MSIIGMIVFFFIACKIVDVFTVKARRESEARIAEHDKRLAEHDKQFAKQAKINAKYEEQMEKLSATIAQANEDIDNLKYRIEEKQKYSKFLQDKRDACSLESEEYFKWNNKLATVDDQIYRMNKQMNKAYAVRDAAERKLSA